MPTKKDLLEAHAFNRRRLVTAFVSGAPGGREVEPERPGRTVVGGVALAVLVLAGGAIAGVFSDRPPDGWLSPGLVVAEGSLYAVTEESDAPELRPTDPISGRLIFGVDEEPASVSVDDVARQRLGDDIGILGAPSYLPGPDLLVDDGWTACTQEGRGTRLSLLPEPAAAPVDDGALVVTTEEGAQRWLVTAGVVDGERDVVQAFRYPLPTDAGGADAVLGALALPVAREAAVVDERWLDLWPEGEPLTLESFDLGQGTVPESADWLDLATPAAAGDLVTDGEASYLVTDAGPVRLDEFATAVYSGLRGDPGPVADGDLQIDLAPAPTPDGWPRLTPEAVVDGSLCAVLRPRVDASPRVLVAAAPGSAATSADLSPGAADVVVEPGRGAFVRAGGSRSVEDSPASPVVVDAKGTRYQVEGDDAVDNLGYGDVAAPLVPDAWLDLLDCGVVLSRDAALAGPGSQAPSPC